jgi:hypothetical protein
MKIKRILVLLVMFAVKSVQAQTSVSGQQLDIGPSPGSNQVTSGAAIGQGNTVDNMYALAVGQGNALSNGSDGLMVGASNNIDTATCSLVLGYANYATEASDSIVGGIENSANQSDCSQTFGIYNAITGSYASLIGGDNNNATNAASSATLGSHLINNWGYSTVIGQYNAYQGGGDLAFVIGIGASDNSRKNAMEVYKDGSIVVPKRQGDIKMGEFGTQGSGD